uniref:Uncharacterized protein n=1 Tax=Parascaris equorum TaxID=6256 RepID=A0A914RP88_PAREQ
MAIGFVELLCFTLFNYAWIRWSWCLVCLTLLAVPPLPFTLFGQMKKVPNCSFASNPCRIQYANREIFCRTIASVGHLTPLPLNFALSQHECLFANPGSFARSQLEFHVYYPSSGEIESSSVSL